MLKFTQIIQAEQAGQPAYTVTLAYQQRILSRQRVTLDNGEEAGFFLTRGTILKEGDYLQAESGETLKIQLAEEQVSTVYCHDPLLLARACYHLGNRHIPLQISAGMLRYQHDAVLDQMLQGLGLQAEVEHAPFVPEAGAYGGGHIQGHTH